MKFKAASSFVLIAALVSVIWSASSAQACSFNEASTTGCTADAPEATAQINGDGVDLSASQNLPGSGNGTTPPKSDGSGGSKATGGAPSAPPPPPPVPPSYHDYYTTTTPFVPTDPVTMSDLVNFKPAAGVSHMEPNGWMIVGLDANFYATAQSQVQTGELLGEQASVRFTPSRYHWNYGDGHSASLAAKGASWAALGIHEFEPTPTSHIYSQPGSFDIDLTIDFSAEYRFAGGNWTAVIGTLPLPANRIHATAGDAKTVLVARDCTANSRGPGC